MKDFCSQKFQLQYQKELLINKSFNDFKKSELFLPEVKWSSKTNQPAKETNKSIFAFLSWLARGYHGYSCWWARTHDDDGDDRVAQDAVYTPANRLSERYSLLWSIDTCQNKVYVDYVIISRAQV